MVFILIVGDVQLKQLILGKEDFFETLNACMMGEDPRHAKLRQYWSDRYGAMQTMGALLIYRELVQEIRDPGLPLDMYAFIAPILIISVQEIHSKLPPGLMPAEDQDGVLEIVEGWITATTSA